MCGIAGIAGPGALRRTEELQRALAGLRHRGPDDQGVHAFADCILGNARLSIVDLERGHQPLITSDGLTAVTFNGAIYGYRAMRAALEPEYPFTTNTDTEVLLALFRRHGTAMLDHLPGMFSFAIWDERQKTLFAARDRFGEKPFYWSRGPRGELIFASEIRAILATGLVEPELDEVSLAHFLHRRYVPVDRTIWKNVGVLAPAHCLTFREGQLDVRRYWDLPEVNADIGPEEAVDELRARLEHAVSLQSVADVPVACFLSGGLDSSTVVAIASRLHGRVRTITLDSMGSTDLPYAREMARRYGTDHVEVSDRDIDLGDAFQRMAEIFDEPLSDKASVSTWVVCRAARRYAKVILSGEGGDELLGGYRHWYRPLRGMERWKGRPAALAVIASFLERAGNRLGIPRDLPLRRELFGATLARRRRSLGEVHELQMEAFRARDVAGFGLPAPRAPHPEGEDSLDGVLRQDVRQLLPGDWLVRTDRASMANGIELRSPFLDIGFATFCLTLPSRLKLNAKEEKWVFRRAFESSWTESVRRRDKQGFQASDGWLDRPDLAPRVRSIFEDRRHPLWELLPYEAVLAATGTEARRRWVIFTLGLWVERWMHGPCRQRPSSCAGDPAGSR